MKKYWHTEKGFISPAGSIVPTGFRFATIRWLFQWLFKKPYMIGRDLPEDHILARDVALSRFHAADEPSITWLGHATFLIRVNGITIITDPLLFGNPAPAIMHSMARVPNPFLPDDLHVDVLLVSHEHHDHIHHASLGSLKNPEKIHPIVPLGLGKKLQKHGFKNSVELDWFDAHRFSDTVSITAVPAVHYSDFSNSTLWAGCIISFKDNIGNERKIYFAGDSGYGEFFKRDIAPYGPFDIAIIGIGAFQINFPTRAPVVHTSPEQAVQAAQDIGAKKLIGMHWGTVKLSDDDPTTLFPRAHAHAKEIGYKGEVCQMKIGETISI